MFVHVGKDLKFCTRALECTRKSQTHTDTHTHTQIAPGHVSCHRWCGLDHNHTRTKRTYRHTHTHTHTHTHSQERLRARVVVSAIRVTDYHMCSTRQTIRGVFRGKIGHILFVPHPPLLS